MLGIFTFKLQYNVMQSISTNNLFMHGHEKWDGKRHCLPPPLEEVRGQLPPLPPQSMRTSWT